MTSATKARSPLVLLLLGLPALAVLIGLGGWQYQRLQWKEALLATIESRIHGAPIPIEGVIAAADSGQDYEYQPVQFSGQLMNEGEQYVLATFDGQSGWHVYVPLHLGAEGARGPVVFVNRGFVPYDKRDPTLRAEGQVARLDNVTGLARAALFAKPSRLVPDNAPNDRTYYWKDLAAMRDAAGLAEADVLPFFVDIARQKGQGSLPIGGVTLIDLPNNHLQYMLTWWGLALGLAGVMAAVALKMRRGTANS